MTSRALTAPGPGLWTWFNGVLARWTAANAAAPDRSPDPILLARDHRVVAANDAARAFWGGGQVLGAPLAHLFDPVAIAGMDRMPFGVRVSGILGHAKAAAGPVQVELSVRATVEGGVSTLAIAVRERSPERHRTSVTSPRRRKVGGRRSPQLDALNATRAALVADHAQLEQQLSARRVELAAAEQRLALVLDASPSSELAAARDSALEEANRLAQVRSEFLANMSHEIRTPLNAVIGLTQVGLRQPDVTPRERTSLGRIHDAGQHLLGVVNDILDVSKADAGKLSVERVPMTLGAVIDRAVGLVAARAYTKGLTMSVYEAADLPSATSGDALRLSQVLVNLLGNAVKFTTTGAVELSVSVEGAQLLFAITDSGIGMTAEQVGRVFVPFEQADGSTTRRFGGTGLGLAISRVLVEAMGGDIRAQSIDGEGSRFEVRIPIIDPVFPDVGPRPTIAVGAMEAAERAALVGALGRVGVQVIDADAATGDVALLLVPAEQVASMEMLQLAWPKARALAVAWTPGEREVDASAGLHVLDRPLRARQVLAAAQGAAAEARAAEVGPRLTGIRVLAAEDSPINRFVLEEMLRAEGVRLTLVEHGLQAIQVLSVEGPHAFDLILTDVQMPEMDGYETCRRVHAMDPSLPVIGLTAHAMSEERNRCFAVGMVHHLAKPVDCDALVAAVRLHARGALVTGSLAPRRQPGPADLVGAAFTAARSGAGGDPVERLVCRD